MAGLSVASWRPNSASRILEGLTAQWGLVEPRKGIGWPFLYWVVVVAVETSVEEEE